MLLPVTSRPELITAAVHVSRILAHTSGNSTALPGQDVIKLAALYRSHHQLCVSPLQQQQLIQCLIAGVYMPAKSAQPDVAAAAIDVLALATSSPLVSPTSHRYDHGDDDDHVGSEDTLSHLVHTLHCPWPDQDQCMMWDMGSDSEVVTSCKSLLHSLLSLASRLSGRLAAEDWSVLQQVRGWRCCM